MSDPKITCPNCATEIKLTESLAAPLVAATKQQFEVRLAQKEADISKRETAIRRQHEELARASEAIDEQVAAKVRSERDSIIVEEAKKARLAAQTEIAQRDKELAALGEVLKERDAKLADAQQAQVELIKKKRELDDAKRELELTVETRVQESLSSVRIQARKEAEEGLGLKVREKEAQISSMQRQIEDLKRKAEQGSQQLQGEALELAIEEILRSSFPRDTITPVPKGEHGGDVIQTVNSPSGQRAGTILWEVKRTKNWSDAWLGKLRDDQRRAQADAALLISNARPKGVDFFDFIDGVWVTDLRCAVPVAMAIRESLVAIAAARQSSTGLTTKTELIYQYLTGPRFRHHVEAIVEKFTEMQEDLEKERKTLTRLWAKREQQIRSVIDATAGMYGDLQGIAGRSLEEIEGLEPKLLDAPPKSEAA